MKKLMVMLTAAATAIGLYAADPIDSTSFEAEGDFAGGVLVKGDKWSCEDAEAKLLQGVYDDQTDPKYAYDQTDNVRYETFGDDQANYLSVKTTFGNPLVRAIGETSVGDEAIFVDQLVKFTATDEDPTTDYPAYNDAKIIVYAQNMTPDEQTEDNHLMVKAGRYADSFGADTYDLGTIDLTAWHRLTIKASKVTASSIGFQIFVDGVAKAFTGKNPAYDAAAAASLTSASFKSLNTYKKLFPSLVEGEAFISDVCFDGQGAIDDLIATTEPAGKWAEDATITLFWTAEQLDGLTYAYGEVPPTPVDDLSSGEQVIPYVDGNTEITLAPVYKEGFGNGYITGDVLVDGLTFKASADGAEATFTAEDVTPRVTVTIGGTATDYPSFAKAFAAISAQAEPAKVVLNQDLELKAITIGTFEGVTEGTITGTAAVTIDLNGKTITGPETCLGGYTIDATTTGGLTITDSSQEKMGKILPSSTGAVSCYGCDLAVDAGTFEGKVDVAEATSSISGGAFKKGEEQEFPLTVASGYTVSEEVEGYWTVVEAPKATVTVTETKVTVEGVATGDKFVEKAEIKFTVTPDQYYAIDTVTVNGTPVEAEDSFYTYTVKPEDIDGGIAIVATAAAKVYTITYLDENGEEITGVDAQYTKFTVETESLDLYVYESEPVDGYDFSGWTLNGEPFTATSFTTLDFGEVDEAGGIELEAAFGKAHEYTITYMNGENELTGLYPATYTIEDSVTLPTEVEALGDTFKGWFDNEKCEGDAVTEISEGETGNKIFYAKVESAGPVLPDVIKGGSEEQQNAYKDWVAKHPHATIDPADPLTIDRFALGLAPDAAQAEIQQTVDNEVPQIDMAALVEGDLMAAVAEIAAKYPNATVILAPTTLEGADTENAKFYQLKISFVPANQGE